MDRNEVPVKYRKLYDKAMAGHNRTAALKLNCLQCVGWLKEEVRNCTSRNDCFLWLYRPFRIPPGGKKCEVGLQAGEKSEQKLIDSYGNGKGANNGCEG